MLEGGRVVVVGYSGWIRSQVARSTTNAYVSGINSMDVQPSDNGSRAYGFPLRCLCMLEGTHEKIV